MEPIILSAYKGTYNKKSLNTDSKYNYKFVNPSVSEIQKEIKSMNPEKDILIFNASKDLNYELWGEGINFTAVYPDDNMCGPYQDRLDSMDYPENEVCDMISEWNSEVRGHDWKKLSKNFVIIDDNQYIDDKFIDSIK